MSAGTFDPSTTTDAITMTATARGHVRRQLARHDAEALELGVKSSGCNGYMYELGYLAPGTTPAAGDRVFDFGGVRVFVAHGNWPLVRGTEIDYVTEGLNSALKFSNPNATGQCGCGESFSVPAPADDPSALGDEDGDS